MPSTSRDMLFQIEMKFTAYKLGFKVKEVPVIFVNRQLGTSKMSGGIFRRGFVRRDAPEMVCTHRKNQTALLINLPFVYSK